VLLGGRLLDGCRVLDLSADCVNLSFPGAAVLSDPRLFVPGRFLLLVLATLPSLLARERGSPRAGSRPRLSEDQIVAWALSHCHRTGDWPSCGSGPVGEAPKEK
jgi:hypothetical protein